MKANPNETKRRLKALPVVAAIGLMGGASLAHARPETKVTCEIDLTALDKGPHYVGEPEPGFKHIVTTARECKKMHGRVVPSVPTDAKNGEQRDDEADAPR